MAFLDTLEDSEPITYADFITWILSTTEEQLKLRDEIDQVSVFLLPYLDTTDEAIARYHDASDYSPHPDKYTGYKDLITTAFTNLEGGP